MENKMAVATKETLCSALLKHIQQRPGLDPRNYISHGRDEAGRSAYRADQRRIGQQRKDALFLLALVRLNDAITAEDIVRAASSAFSGRLEWNGKGWDYCTGQYWPTEYRAAACTVLANVLWRHWVKGYQGEKPGVFARAQARKVCGSGIARRWFN